MSALEHRIPPPLVMAGCGALMWLAAGHLPVLATPISARWLLAGGVLTAASLLMLPALRAFVRARTTVSPLRVDAASTLVTTGVFAVSRNPMYAAMALTLGAWAILLSSPWTLAGPALFAAYITRFQILPEERALAARFGEGYADYRRRVRRWL